MSIEYLSDSYEFDSSMLIEPIRKASQLRASGIHMDMKMQPSDKVYRFESVIDDFGIGIEAEPFKAPRSVQQIIRTQIEVPVIDAELWYSTDELDRLNNSKLPWTARVQGVAEEIARIEEAYAFCTTFTGVDTLGAKPFMASGNNTAQAFDIDAYSTGITTLGDAIGALSTEFGGARLKQYPLKLFLNDAAFATGIGVLNTNSDRTLFEAFDTMLKMYGGPGSGIQTIPYLGGTLTKTDGRVKATVSSADVVALVHAAPYALEVVGSGLDTRMRPFNRAEGQYLKFVERMAPYVHKIKAIRLDDDATP